MENQNLANNDIIATPIIDKLRQDRWAKAVNHVIEVVRQDTKERNVLEKVKIQDLLKYFAEDYYCNIKSMNVVRNAQIVKLAIFLKLYDEYEYCDKNREPEFSDIRLGEIFAARLINITQHKFEHLEEVLDKQNEFTIHCHISALLGYYSSLSSLKEEKISNDGQAYIEQATSSTLNEIAFCALHLIYRLM